MAKKKIVIIGDGHVGFDIAKTLDEYADVTLNKLREAVVQSRIFPHAKPRTSSDGTC